MNFDSILVTTDFSSAAEHAFSAALKQAQLNKGRIILLHVLQKIIMPIDPMGNLPDLAYSENIERASEEAAKKKLDQSLKSFSGQAVESKLISSFEHPGDVIADFARKEKCNLIIMGSQGKSALTRLLLGSTIERVLRHAPCPVMAIPNDKSGEK